jgi:hypothetical protein
MWWRKCFEHRYGGKGVIETFNVGPHADPVCASAPTSLSKAAKMDKRVAAWLVPRVKLEAGTHDDGGLRAPAFNVGGSIRLEYERPSSKG